MKTPPEHYPSRRQDHVLWLADSWPQAVRAHHLWGGGDGVAGLQARVLLPCCPPRACLPYCPLPPFTGPPDSPRALRGCRDRRAWPGGRESQLNPSVRADGAVQGRVHEAASPTLGKTAGHVPSGRLGRRTRASPCRLCRRSPCLSASPPGLQSPPASVSAPSALSQTDEAVVPSVASKPA